MTEKPAPRSRRMLVLWAVALVLLLAAGVFCWAVVVPVWQVRTGATGGWEWEDVDRLGGPARTVRKVRLYMRCPDGIAPKKPDALDVLVYCGRPAAPLLIQFTTHSDPKIRMSALLSLNALGTDAPEAVPILMRAFTDENPRVRWSAARAFLDYSSGPWRRAAAPALKKLLQDENAAVRDVAAEALRKIKAGEGEK